MNIVEMCDRVPRVEYLFGVFCRRHWQTAQTDPKRVLLEFRDRNPAIIDQTALQLARLIQYCTIQPEPEDAALDILEEMDCPYYPPYDRRTATAWLREVHAILGRNPEVTEPLADYSCAEVEALDEPSSIEGAILPLHLVYALLAGCDLPLQWPGLLSGPAIDLAAISRVVVESRKLGSSLERLKGIVPISASFEPLREVSSCRTH